MCQGGCRALQGASRSLPLIAALFLVAQCASGSSDLVDDATILAAGFTDELLPDPATVDRIERDLQVLRAQFPHLVPFRAHRRYTFGKLILAPESPEALRALESGSVPALEALASRLGPFEVVRTSTGSHLVVKFHEPYDSLRLARRLEGTIPGVEFVSIDFCDWNCGNLQSKEPGEYLLVHGWGDCEAGCIHEHRWRFRVEGKTATLVEETGDPLPEGEAR